MEWLKSLWASWKVRVALVGGAVVVATAYGTCSLDPTTVSDASTTTTETTTETVEVSATTTETTTPSTNETTPTTNTSGE